MSRLLAAVRTAARRRRDADTAYREAMRAARDAGHAYAEIGEAAGIGYEGARYIIQGDPRKRGGHDA